VGERQPGFFVFFSCPCRKAQCVATKGGELSDECYLAAGRIAGPTSEALSQESSQKRCIEHRAAETLVRFQERIAAHPEEKGGSPV